MIKTMNTRVHFWGDLNNCSTEVDAEELLLLFNTEAPLCIKWKHKNEILKKSSKTKKQRIHYLALIGTGVFGVAWSVEMLRLPDNRCDLGRSLLCRKVADWSDVEADFVGVNVREIEEAFSEMNNE
jgi:hypothetical protein